MPLVFLVSGLLTTIGFIVLALLAPAGSNYKVAPAFLIPLLWLIYFLRRKIHLLPSHFVLLCLALLMHNLGALGAYQRIYLGIHFDNWLHFYFGFVGGLIFRRLIETTVPLGPWQLRSAVVAFVMGIGAIHELYEWASTLALGPERGMLKLSDPTDTHRDLFSNLLGVLLALIVTFVWGLRKSRTASDADRG